MSMVVIRGWFSVRQFFPIGSSDADTIRIKVASALFRADGKEKNIYKDLSNAFVAQSQADGTTSYERVFTDGELRVRLQHIDAPELHYPCSNKVDYRQPRGASSARRVLESLSWINNEWIPCELVTEVDHPSEAFDCYGRFIGDVLYGVDRRNLNLQVLESGLAFVSLYDSASPSERQAARKAAKAGRGAFGSIWTDYTDVLVFDPNLRFIAHGLEPEESHKDVVLPKLFRRLAQYYSEMGAVDMPKFHAWLKDGGEQVMVERPGEPMHKVAFADVLSCNADGSVRLVVEPDELVFIESPATMLVQSGDTFAPWRPKTK